MDYAVCGLPRTSSQPRYAFGKAVAAIATVPQPAELRHFGANRAENADAEADEPEDPTLVSALP